MIASVSWGWPGGKLVSSQGHIKATFFFLQGAAALALQFELLLQSCETRLWQHCCAMSIQLWVCCLKERLTRLTVRAQPCLVTDGYVGLLLKTFIFAPLPSPLSHPIHPHTYLSVTPTLSLSSSSLIVSLFLSSSRPFVIFALPLPLVTFSPLSHSPVLIFLDLCSSLPSHSPSLSLIFSDPF